MAKDDDRPQLLVGIAFTDALRAQEFLIASTRLAAAGKLHLVDAVVVARDDKGHTVVRETTDPQPGRSALSAGMWAGLFGLFLGGPVGWLAGAAIGASAGAITAKVVDLGIPDDWVAWFREAVQPGSVIVALLVTDLNRNALVDEAARFPGAHLDYANLEPNSVERIRSAFGEAAAEPAAPGSPLPPPPDTAPTS